MEVHSTPVDPKDLQALQICAPILNFHRNFITIVIKRKEKKIAKTDRFHVEFRPNFFTSAMAQRALRRITSSGYENFLLNFTKSSLPVKASSLFQKFEQIEWLNQDVGENFAQSQAIKHIVNRSSFPSPYIVFGPPGKRVNFKPIRSNGIPNRNRQDEHAGGSSRADREAAAVGEDFDLRQLEFRLR